MTSLHPVNQPAPKIRKTASSLGFDIFVQRGAGVQTFFWNLCIVFPLYIFVPNGACVLFCCCCSIILRCVQVGFRFSFFCYELQFELVDVMITIPFPVWDAFILNTDVDRITAAVALSTASRWSKLEKFRLSGLLRYYGAWQAGFVGVGISLRKID